MALPNDYIILTFKTDKERNVNLRVRNAERTVHKALVKTTMNQLISANALNEKYGNLTAIGKAVLYEVSREPYGVK